MKTIPGTKFGKTRLFGLLGIFALAVAHGAPAQESFITPSIKETGHRFAGLPSTIQPIFWLDDYRILYTGWEPNIKTIRKEDGRTVTKVGIYVLDLRSNQAKRHSDAEGFLCYRDGYVRYTVTYDPKTRIAVRREGKFGEEKELLVDMKQQPAGYRVNPLTCREYDARGNAADRGRRLPLLDGHGVLEFSRLMSPAPGSPMHPARLFRGMDSEPITLAVNGAAVSESRVRFYEFANAYTVGYVPPAGFWWNWPKNAVHRVFLLSPDGKVTEIQMSGGDWSDVPVTRFVLTTAGVVVYAGKLGKNRDPGTTGIYLVQGNRTVKVASGLLIGIGVSPNGCMVAAAMQTYRKIPDPTMIRIVDLCAEGRAK